MNEDERYKTPPQPYAQYYRPGAYPTGSAERLQALSDGYYGLSWIFLANVICAIGIGLISLLMRGGVTNSDVPSVSSSMNALLFQLGAICLLAVVIAIAVYKPCKRIAFGMGWASSTPVLVSVLMGINAAFCCGIVGYAILQQISYSQMKKYGVPTGFMGPRKKDVQQVVAYLNEQERQTPPESPLPPNQL